MSNHVGRPCRDLDDDTIEIDNNAAERTLRGIALGRKNWLFAGSDTGGGTAAAIFSLIETAKLNGIDPEAYLRSVIRQIAGHPANRVYAQLRWSWVTAQQHSSPAVYSPDAYPYAYSGYVGMTNSPPDLWFSTCD